MKKYLQTILIFLAVGIVLTGTFYFGRSTAPITAMAREIIEPVACIPQPLQCDCTQDNINVFQGCASGEINTGNGKIRITGDPEEVEIINPDTKLKHEDKLYKLSDIKRDISPTLIK